MSIREDAFLFDCHGEQLVGIVAAPENGDVVTGVLVVVGGPQYRVGSHRQFVLLARQLAANGIACMRFDYRGMGDATGVQRDFETVTEDIRSAIDAFKGHEPKIERVILWGLCDGASAACFYAPLDPRVTGTVLLNPWVKTVSGEAKVLLKHYYLNRLRDPAFWKKLLGGGVVIGKSVLGLLKMVRRARVEALVSAKATEKSDLPGRMAHGLTEAGKPLLVILSGRDYVAREFEQVVRGDLSWSRLTNVARQERLELADHTFSSARWRDEVARLTCNWVLESSSKNWDSRE